MIDHIVVASSNKGKIKEISGMMHPSSLKVTSLKDYPTVPPIVESGSTYAENALIKARTVFEYTARVSLGDDSGIEVEALNGRPGLHSARYAGGESFSQKCIDKLLREMKDVPAENRHARFVCVMALVGRTRSGEMLEEVFEGICTGVITDASIGNGGFGYDPIFYIPSLGKTVAQLTPDVKNKISHRRVSLAESKGLPELTDEFYLAAVR